MFTKILEDYLLSAEGCREIEIMNISNGINKYCVDYKVIRKCDSFIREKVDIEILDLLDFIYKNKN
ncbi:hypothetical protein D1004_03725 [Riemerella anatipestifer]|nr:hypothetical protein [Riemerella anatipestifer]